MILALNETRKTLLASRLLVVEQELIAGGDYASDIRPGDGVWLEPCGSIDTRSIRVPVDLLFLDADHRVLAAVSEMRARTDLPAIPGALAVLALAPGTIRLSKTREGDHIALDPIAQPNGAELPTTRAPRF